MSQSPQAKSQSEAIMDLITPLSERICNEHGDGHEYPLTPAEEKYLTALWAAWEVSLDL
jgi:hypothetical protein